MTQSPHTG